MGDQAAEPALPGWPALAEELSPPNAEEPADDAAAGAEPEPPLAAEPCAEPGAELEVPGAGDRPAVPAPPDPVRAAAPGNADPGAAEPAVPDPLGPDPLGLDPLGLDPRCTAPGAAGLADELARSAGL